MARCMSCGKTAMLTTKFGKVILCKKCGELINVTEWSNGCFESMNQLINTKNNVLQQARNNSMSYEVVKQITDFFDEYINDEYITYFDGKAGQILKVFKNYCLVFTKNDMKKTELVNIFYQFEEDDEEDNSFLTNETIKLAKGLVSGKIVSAGIGMALNASQNKQEK